MCGPHVLKSKESLDSSKYGRLELVRQLLRTYHATVARDITVTENDRKGAWATFMLALDIGLPGGLRTAIIPPP